MPTTTPQSNAVGPWIDTLVQYQHNLKISTPLFFLGNQTASNITDYSHLILFILIITHCFMCRQDLTTKIFWSYVIINLSAHISRANIIHSSSHIVYSNLFIQYPIVHPNRPSHSKRFVHHRPAFLAYLDYLLTNTVKQLNMRLICRPSIIHNKKTLLLESRHAQDM